MLFLYKCFSPYMWVFDSCLVIFLCGVKVGVQLHSFGCEYLVVPASFIIYLFITHFLFPFWIALTLLSKSFAHRCKDCFWILYYISLTYISVIIQISTCVDYCSFIVNIKIKMCESSNFVLFKIGLPAQGPLHIYINFSINSSISSKKPAGILIRIVFNQ